MLVAGIIAVFVLVAGAIAVAVLGARDRGLMPRVPANAFPASVDVGAGVDAARVRNAATWWNLRLGREAFVDHETTGVTVMFDVDADLAVTARTTFVPDRRLVQVLVRDGPSLRALCHELGHVLGLDHDLDPASVMYIRDRGGYWDVTDKDLELVRERLWPS